MMKRRGIRGLARSLRGSIVVFLLTPVALALAANPNVETRISAAKVRAGESFSLHIELHGPPGQAVPDLTPLEEAFEILGVNQSQRQSYVNGAFAASSNWDITLLPKKTGRLDIPSLAIGSASTASGSILVSSAGQPPAAINQASNPGAWPEGAAAVQVRADKLDPYEQERVVLRVRLYAGDGLIEGSLAEPHVEGATVERVGEDQTFEEEIKGHVYQGVERVYTVLPERVGELVVSPIVFDGFARDSSYGGQSRRQRRRGYARPSLMDDFFGGSLFDDDLLDRVLGQGRRRVVARSEPLTLDVRPRPEASQGSWWLPASGLSLEEDWKPSPDRARVGETLTRRITLRVEGASAIQLPPLALPDVAGIKQYVEAPQISEVGHDTIRVQDATVIPTQPGTFELPAIEISWWDTQADVPRTASLPARTFEVLPAIGGGSGAKPVAAQPAPQPASAASSLASGLEFEGQLNPQAGPSTPWVVWALGLGGLAAGAVLWAWARGRGTRSDAHGEVGGRARPGLRGAERALRRACRRSRPAEAESALRDIVRIRDAQSRRSELGRWAKALGSEAFDAEIAKLLAVQYSSTDQPWQGEALWKAYRRAVKRKPILPRGRADRGLPPLYPGVNSKGDAHGVV